MDLMAIAEGSTGSKTKKKNPWLKEAEPAAAKAPPPKPAEDPLAALRKLEQLQLQHSSSKKLVSTPSTPAVYEPGKSIHELLTGNKPSSASKPHAHKKDDPEALARASTDDWTCKNCAKKDAESLGDCTVPGGFKYCPTCGDSATGTTNPHPPPGEVTDDWECHCKEFNTKSFRFCVECGLPHGAEKPPPEGECGGCGETLGESFVFCPDCGTLKGLWNKGAAKADAPSKEDSDDWTCAGCQEGLPADFTFCINCGQKRPTDGGSASIS